ncbi:hypothetical protein ACPPVU_09055 [Mucilaginibacter sp. McL0603]|uniref:hypothetical protein n=1 Tax=Mucilaginibacter sp. McL0603 TaxID=3415670 RepID=UPI003CF30195
MGNPKSLNEKRLTKKQVQQIITSEGRLHEEYTECFKDIYASGYIQQDLVYELSNDRFLFVFDPQEKSIGGKGDIFTKDYLIRRIKWRQRVKDDYANNRGSSVSHWRFYSKHKNDFIKQVDVLITELAKILNIDIKNLNKTYKSLDIVSESIEQYGIDNAIINIYDNLVAYIGEVVRTQVDGNWEINSNSSGGPYPYIDIGLKRIQYMPINIVWDCLHGLEIVDFRKAAGNEARQVGAKASIEKGEYGQKI